jgi:hypothetical protein
MRCRSRGSGKSAFDPYKKPIAYRSRKRMVIPNNHRNWNRGWWRIFHAEDTLVVLHGIPCPLTEEEQEAHMRYMLANRL